MTRPVGCSASGWNAAIAADSRDGRVLPEKEAGVTGNSETEIVTSFLGADLKTIHPALFVPILRGLDRILPVPLLYGALFPIAFVRAFLHRLLKGRRTKSLPGCFRRSQSVSPFLPRLPVYLNRSLEFLPGSLARPKWRARCPIEGLEPIQQAVREKRRVLLAFLHFSLYGQLRNWLRAAGLPVATFVGAVSRERSGLKRRKDRWALFPDIPTAFHSDQLAEALRFLRAGNPLLIALDGIRGKSFEIPACDGWTFQMATGPLRIAANHNAEIYPCVLTAEGTWRFRIRIGEPVPKHLLEPGKEVEAGTHLLRQMLPEIERHPEQCREQLLDLFTPSKPSMDCALKPQ